ncbi:MAG: hypothetical protein ACFFER_16245 [Candidatus Thorarchaeota archaeon]
MRKGGLAVIALISMLMAVSLVSTRAMARPIGDYYYEYEYEDFVEVHQESLDPDEDHSDEIMLSTTVTIKYTYRVSVYGRTLIRTQWDKVVHDTVLGHWYYDTVLDVWKIDWRGALGYVDIYIENGNVIRWEDSPGIPVYEKHYVASPKKMCQSGDILFDQATFDFTSIVLETQFAWPLG